MRRAMSCGRLKIAKKLVRREFTGVVASGTAMGANLAMAYVDISTGEAGVTREDYQLTSTFMVCTLQMPARQRDTQYYE
jgi:hypothetical protein